MIKYYTEDKIVDLDKFLKRLKGKLIMDDRHTFYMVMDHNIESVTNKKGFLNKKEVTEFYIEWIDIKVCSINKVVRETNPEVCCEEGIYNLAREYNTWIELQNNLIKVSENTGIPLNFSSVIHKSIEKD